MTEKTSAVAAISMKEKKGLGKKKKERIFGGLHVSCVCVFLLENIRLRRRELGKNVFFACQTDECGRNSFPMMFLRCFSL